MFTVQKHHMFRETYDLVNHSFETRDYLIIIINTAASNQISWVR